MLQKSITPSLLLLTLAFILPTSASANMIFPAALLITGISIMSLIIIGIPIVLVEAFALSSITNTSFKKAVLATLIANLVSSLVGALVFGTMLTFITMNLFSSPVSLGSYTLSILTFLIGTIFIEYIFTKPKYKEFDRNKILTAISIGNLFTYGLCIIAMIVDFSNGQLSP